MNKEQTLKAIEVMQAYVEGKKIELRWNSAHDWKMLPREDGYPSWNWDEVTYRVKPASKPSINWEHVHPDYKWLATDADGETYLYKEEPSLMARGDGAWPAGWDWGDATIFASFTPGDCDWKDSLVQRPEIV